VPLTALKDDTDEFIRYVPQLRQGTRERQLMTQCPFGFKEPIRCFGMEEHASSLLLRGFLMNRIVYCLHIQHGEDSAMAAAVYAII
jgi:hypothetical protein